MSEHAREAAALLLDLDANSELWPDLTAPMLIAQRANIAALLAIAEHLGELIEQQKIANAMHGIGHMGVLNSDAELRPAREAVRRLLGLDPTTERQ
ncbi:hypothetical protein [Nocardia arizonensis]|uniref:hypothetical protein n=1 Tax=Nocardia arizonensis TaxID=1141647 RepID=UPI0006D163E2|nr:hypothetical protein [Nocardia arizonensis]